MHPTGPLHRFGQDGGDALTMLGEHRGRRLQVIVGNLDEVGHEVAPTLAVGGDALCRGPTEVGSVVAVGALDDDLTALGAPSLLDQAGQLEGGIHRLGARAAQKGPSVGVGRAFHDHLGYPGRRAVGERCEGVVGLDLVHLGGDGVDYLRTTVANLAQPQVGHAVDVVLTVGVED